MKVFRVLFYLIFIMIVLNNCGGGSNDSIQANTQEKTLLATYDYPSESLFSEYNKALALSLEETQRALLQAILLVNTYIYTDPKTTTFSEFMARYDKAKEALQILDDCAEFTLFYESLEEDFEQASTYYRKYQKVHANDIIAPHPFGGHRPLKTIMEKYQVSARKAMKILEQMADEVTADAYKEAGDAYNISQKRVEAAVETIKLGGVAVGGAVAIMASPTALTIGGAYIMFTGQTCKMAVALSHLASAETGTKETQTPKIFVPVVDAAEVVSVITLKSGTNVLIYGTEKWQDLIKSGGNSISFGTHNIEVFKITSSAMDIPQDLDSSKYPVMLPGSYLSPDGNNITVNNLSKEYKNIIFKISPDNELIEIPDDDNDDANNDDANNDDANNDDANNDSTEYGIKSCRFDHIYSSNESANYTIRPTVIQDSSINGGKFNFIDDWETQEFEFSTNLKLLNKPIDLGTKREIGSLEVSITHKLITTHSGSNILEPFNMYLNGIGSSGGSSYPFFTEIEEEQNIIFSPDVNETKQFSFKVYDNDESRESNRDMITIWAGILSPSRYQATFYIYYKCE